MIDHVIKEGIINIQSVIQIPRSRIESFNNFRLVIIWKRQHEDGITEHKQISYKRGIVSTIGIPTICRYNLDPNLI